ncbi:chymotrypsin-like protease CTRL-1 [Drosophila kikkawai]|uniref:Chymotrypsin-like protease CTRL-1 n=1 Tax=Drosophila kikkawai TaxID=30033 RepID=A0ABM4GCR3_DROKI
MNTKAVGIKIFASLLLLVAFLQPGTGQFLDPNCGLRSAPVYVQSRIINGTDAGVTSSPWMVFILTTDDYFICGGTLITPRSYQKARMGEFNRDWNDGKCLDSVDGATYCNNRKEIRVDNGVMHPRFNSESLANDIAILRLAEYVEYTGGSGFVLTSCCSVSNMYLLHTENIRPICIVLNKSWRNFIDEINTLTVTGWGLTSKNGSTSRILQTLQIKRRPSKDCTWYIGRSPFHNEFCMGNEQSSVCNGDSGGPVGKMIWYNGFRRFVQVGVASLTNRQCSKASISTDVLSHVDWILSVQRQIGLGYRQPTSVWSSTIRKKNRHVSGYIIKWRRVALPVYG